MKAFFKKHSQVPRRDFLAYSAKCFLGVGLMPHLIRNTLHGKEAPIGRPSAKNVIYLYMAGGMSHLDTFDPKPGMEQQGPVETIKTNVDGMQFTEYLPSLARQADKLAVVRSLSSTQGAHQQGNYFMHSSYTMRGTIRHPGLGSWLVKMDGKLNKNLPGAVRIGGSAVGGGAGFFETRYAPLVIGNPEQGLQNSKLRKGVSEGEMQQTLALTDAFDTEFHKRYDYKLVRAYSDMYDDAVKLMKSEDLKAFDLKEEKEELRQAYGKNSFGQGCLLARRLVEHDVRFVEVTLGGWDTHSDNFEKLPDKTKVLDDALATLLNDLELRGMLEETMVVLATEFGRTPQINESLGRDHSPSAFSCVLAGGGIRGGQIFGHTDQIGKMVTENQVTVPDFNATIAYAVGLPIEEEYISPSGRPFTVADKGKPITQLFS
ncbi:MAG: DUF1501 domain-containing protein [Verrucomicrobiota bacterium]